jgi:hypothetical protein
MDIIKNTRKSYLQSSGQVEGMCSFSLFIATPYAIAMSFIPAVFRIIFFSLMIKANFLFFLEYANMKNASNVIYEGLKAGSFTIYF